MESMDAAFAASKGSPLRAVLLGWPTLFAVWVYTVWFLWRTWSLLTSSRDIVHDGVSSIDRDWLTLLLPSMYIPTIVVFAYCNWLGWKFFQHN
mmetsp:Transcript_66299/g.76937  ORF Transcript_66299/g.76937 Transcript_66299/m.76937 type:complete len:93 (+) Transcript_66299:30-308(+)